MQKHWKIRPWIFIVVIVVLAGGVLFALGKLGMYENSGSSSDSYGGENSYTPVDYSVKSITVPIAAPQAKEMAAPGSSYGVSASTSAPSAVSTAKVERMVIKQGSLSLVVSDVVASVKAITDYVEKNGGYLVTSNLDKSGIALSGQVTARVPSIAFDKAVDQVKGMGDVQSQYVSGQDITSQYVDLESQLKNLQAAESQFLAIMKKAVKIEDILAVQSELTNVRGQIESLTGQMKYMKESVDMSSLTVYLSTDPTQLPVLDKGDEWKPFAVLKDAFRSLLGAGETIVDGLIWVGVFLPLIAIVGVVVWVIRKLVRRWRRVKK